MNEKEKARWLFDQVQAVANRRRSTTPAAAEFYSATYQDKVDYMNTVVFPSYEAAGSPEPYTEDCLQFTSAVFNEGSQP